jgi:hypothetical protein
LLAYSNLSLEFQIIFQEEKEINIASNLKNISVISLKLYLRGGLNFINKIRSKPMVLNIFLAKLSFNSLR